MQKLLARLEHRVAHSQQRVSGQSAVLFPAAGETRGRRAGQEHVRRPFHHEPGRRDRVAHLLDARNGAGHEAGADYRR